MPVFLYSKGIHQPALIFVTEVQQVEVMPICASARAANTAWARASERQIASVS
jgi:hypothetical protein